MLELRIKTEARIEWQIHTKNFHVHSPRQVIFGRYMIFLSLILTNYS